MRLSAVAIAVHAACQRRGQTAAQSLVPGATAGAELQHPVSGWHPTLLRLIQVQTHFITSTHTTQQPNACAAAADEGEGETPGGFDVSALPHDSPFRRFLAVPDDGSPGELPNHRAGITVVAWCMLSSSTPCLSCMCRLSCTAQAYSSDLVCRNLVPAVGQLSVMVSWVGTVGAGAGSDQRHQQLQQPALEQPQQPALQQPAVKQEPAAVAA